MKPIVGRCWRGWLCRDNRLQILFKLRDIALQHIPNHAEIYSPYHEMDITQFVDEIDRLYRMVHPETNLRRIRERFGISQGDLASISGVSVRTIQEFEQLRKNINKAQLDTVYPLAQALCTTIESLVERVP